MVSVSTANKVMAVAMFKFLSYEETVVNAPRFVTFYFGLRNFKFGVQFSTESANSF